MLEMVTPQLPLWSDKDATNGWLVRESDRARRLTVRVFHSGRVEVVVPARTTARAVERFIERHRNWIDRKREEALRRAAPPAPFPPAKIDFSASNESWRVHLGGGGHGARLHACSDGLLTLTGNVNDGHAVRLLLRRWLTDKAREFLGPTLERCARELGFEYERMLVRRQRTRWGSCSTRGTISLNCCLLFQRPPVVRYLLIHELVHTLHMNHSHSFWQRVARHCPDYSGLDRELLDGWRRVPSWVFADERSP
jgi:predicted metal-dependent hydrolase